MAAMKLFVLLVAAWLQLGTPWGMPVALEDVPEGEYLLPVGGANEVVPEAHKQRNLQSAIAFLRSLGGPIAVNISRTFISGQVPTVPTTGIPVVSGSWAGQIRPLGVYDNLEKSAEYFYIMPRAVVFRAATSLGLSFFRPLTEMDPLLPVWEGTKVVVPEAFADGNMVSIVYNNHAALLSNLTFAGPWVNEATFELTGKMYFDRQGAMCGYDLLAPNFGALWKGIEPLTDPGFPSQEVLDQVPDSRYKRAYLPLPGVTTWLEEICDVATGDMCFPVTGTKFYADKADCMRKLGSKRAGTHDDLDQDTLACRALHRLLVPSRPEGHCMHLAADLAEEDGGVCIDRDSAPYNSRQFQCGYDDVGYTNSIASTGGAYATPGYPFSLADFAITTPVTVPDFALNI